MDKERGRELERDRGDEKERERYIAKQRKRETDGRCVWGVR